MPNCLVRSTDFAYSADDDPVDVVTRSTPSWHHARLPAPERRLSRRSLPPVEFGYTEPLSRASCASLTRIASRTCRSASTARSYQWVDLDGEGLSGILTEQGGTWFYKRNLGDGRLRPAATVAGVPTAVAEPAGAQLVDLAGDGRLDLVQFAGPSAGLLRAHRRRRLGAVPRLPRRCPTVDWDDPNLRFVDLNGDGHADC